MSDAATFLHATLNPAIATWATWPGWTVPTDDRARVLMLAIAGQESGWEARVQGNKGPAHSFWQMERTGGVRGVLTHPASKALAKIACDNCYVEPDEVHVWGVFSAAKGDVLAAAFARLLLWTDPEPLPGLGQGDHAWLYYERNWRPGKPRPDRWGMNYGLALHAVEAPPGKATDAPAVTA